MLRTLSAALLKDPLLRWIFSLPLLLAVPCLLLLRSTESHRQLLTGPWDLVEVLLLVSVVLWSANSLPGRNERTFWRYLAGGLSCWFLAKTASLLLGLQGEGQAGILVDLFVDSLYLAYYSSLVFATEVHPERGESVPPRSVEVHLNFWGATLFTFALLIYFVHIPKNLHAAAIDRWYFAPLLFLSLDLFLAGRFAVLALTRSSLRWQVVYRLLFLAFGALALANGLETLALLNWAPPWAEYGGFRVVPFLLILCAARLQHHLPFDAVAPTAGEDDPEGVTSLWIYTIAFPLMHLLLHYTNQDDPTTHASRDVLVIAYFLVLGAMAWVQHRHRDERRKRAEQQLRDSEDNYRQLVESTHHAILVLGADHILYANSRACQLFDLAQPPIPGSFESLGLPEPEAPDRVEHRALSIETRRRAREGRQQNLEMTYRAISYLGQPAWQLLVRDTTALHRLRQQNRRMARLASLGELATDFTNQVRPSLAALASGWRQLSRRLPLEAEDQEDFDLAIERIERIVDNVHGFSHVEEPNLSEQDLAQILSAAVRSLRDVFSLRGIEIQKYYQHREARVLADRHQMLQVFTNVLDNAHLAMADGGKISIETSNSPGAIEIVISDSGEGIASDRLERIFDPFYTTRQGGTGLGLAVVTRILGRHGCWHAVESEAGRGTRFSLSFPLARSFPPLQPEATR